MTSEGREPNRPAPQHGVSDDGRSSDGRPNDGPAEHGSSQYGQAQYAQGPYGQGPYGQAEYGQGYPHPPAYRKTNTLSIVAIILGFVLAPGGIVCGHLALNQIKRTGEEGRPLALTGLIVGYVFTGMFVLIFLSYIIGIIGFLAIAGTAGLSA